MSGFHQTIGIFISYTVVILGTLMWSGTTVEKTLYDKYIIYLEGAILPTSDERASAEFYGQMLDFNRIPPKKLRSADEIAFLLTEKKALYFRETAQSIAKGPVLLVRVRNGFQKLHAELLRRYGKQPQMVEPTRALEEIKSGHVSQIFQGERGEQFVISDPDNNRMLFYRHKLRLFG